MSGCPPTRPSAPGGVLDINANLEGFKPGRIPGSIGDIIARYKASPEFKRLADATSRSYLLQLSRLEEAFATDPIEDIDVTWLYGVRDALADTPRTADLMLSVLSILLNFAVARGFPPGQPGPPRQEAAGRQEL